VIVLVGVVAVLGMDFRSRAEELPGAGAELAYPAGSDRQPYIISPPGWYPL
jgi:hypothetical protein